MPTLAEYPDLAAQFDRKKNRPLTPETISYGSARRVWWRCPEGPDHRWQTTPNARTGGQGGCPFCTGKRVSVTNSLATCAPEVAAEWHRAKNRPATPETTHAGTHHKFWWKCHRGHTWQSGVYGRVQRGNGCPYCGHRRTTLANSLAVIAPELAAEWHPTKNGALLPRELLSKSNREVWWKCPQGDDHEWTAAVGERADSPSGRTACPFCDNRRLSTTNILALRYPEVAAQWHPKKNGKRTPHEVTYRSMERAWWRCASGHEWSTRIYQRTELGTRCPYCVGRLVTPQRSLATIAPKLAKWWHPTRNGSLTPREVMPNSTRRVWWKCPKGDDHEWETRLANQFTAKSGLCPFCAGRRVSKTNALSTCYPKVAQQWHPTRNGTLTPRDVCSNSSRHVWWLCASGHEWQAGIYKRTGDGHNCRQCGRRKQPVAVTGRKRRGVVLAGYEGPQHGPVRRVR